MVDLIVQRPHHWIGHEKLPQNDPSYATICPVVPKLWKGLLPCQLICTVSYHWIGHEKLLKMSPHMLQSAHWFQSYGKVFFHVSWFVQWPHHSIRHEKLPQYDPSYATICPLVPKLWTRPDRPGKLRLYCTDFFYVSWFVQWPHNWIGHEKLPQNDPSYATICPLVPKLWKGLLPCQLICTLTSPLDWAWKTTPKWPLICHNQLIGSKIKQNRQTQVR